MKVCDSGGCRQTSNCALGKRVNVVKMAVFFFETGGLRCDEWWIREAGEEAD